jgi:hypothetical protein
LFFLQKQSRNICSFAWLDELNCGNCCADHSERAL